MPSSALLQRGTLSAAPVIKLNARGGREFREPAVTQPGPREAPACDVLHEIFEAQADARPEAVALAFGRENLTYADLERRANGLARHLRNRGVRGGARVAMLLPRSVEAYVALVGILKAGAAYV